MVKTYADYVKYFGKKAKETALNNKLPNQILVNKNVKVYFILNDLHEFVDFLQYEEDILKLPLNYFEHTPDNVPVNLVFDIEADFTKNPAAFANRKKILEDTRDEMKRFFKAKGYDSRAIVTEAHRLVPKVIFFLNFFYYQFRLEKMISQ
jgi:hypothetical protein